VIISGEFPVISDTTAAIFTIHSSNRVARASEATSQAAQRPIVVDILQGFDGDSVVFAYDNIKRSAAAVTEAVLLVLRL
jgi:hypothetical protein